METKVVNRTSLSDQAILLIKNKILSMEYLPGQRLVVDTLADEINVSRTPVREGFKALVMQGLLEYEGKGYTIFKPTIQEVVDLFLIRRSLEALAAQQATNQMTENEITELEKLYLDYKIIKSGKELHRLMELDILFHDLIMKGARNSRLTQILNSIREQCWLIRKWGYGDNELSVEEVTVSEHLAIIDCIAKKDAQGAASAMEYHLKMGEQRTIELPNLKKLL